MAAVGFYFQKVSEVERTETQQILVSSVIWVHLTIAWHPQTLKASSFCRKTTAFLSPYFCGIPIWKCNYSGRYFSYFSTYVCFPHKFCKQKILKRPRKCDGVSGELPIASPGNSPTTLTPAGPPFFTLPRHTSPDLPPKTYRNGSIV